MQEVTGAWLPCQHHGRHVSDDLLLLTICHGRKPFLQAQLPLATEEQQEAHLTTQTQGRGWGRCHADRQRTSGRTQLTIQHWANTWKDDKGQYEGPQMRRCLSQSCWASFQTFTKPWNQLFQCIVADVHVKVLWRVWGLGVGYGFRKNGMMTLYLCKYFLRSVKEFFLSIFNQVSPTEIRNK